MHMRQRLGELKRAWVTYWRPQPPSDRRGLVPHDPLPSSGRCLAFRRLVVGCLYQPLDAIHEYYGAAVAFYFAWLGFYTRWLLAPALMGTALFTAQVSSGQIDHPAVPLYALAMAAWATLLLVGAEGGGGG